tara:strand:- start:84459 stop:84911 length:453 start_codon:yes stop_codon:yes gene_type:complete
MKKFNQVIEVKVEVDQIANKLLETMGTNEKHRELVTETIIGTLIQGHDTLGISLLYNALQGFTNEIDFTVGEEIICDIEVYQYIADANDNTVFNQERTPIGVATIVDIDIYRNDKIKLEFTVLKDNGEEKTTDKWVNHKTCNKIIIPEMA